MIYIIVLLVPIAFLPKGSVLIEAEISYIEVPKVFLFRSLLSLGIPFLALALFKRDIKFNAVFLVTTSLSVWYIIATIFSQSPAISYWGEFFGQDSYSSLAAGYYWILFMSVVLAFQNRDQLNRLLMIICISGTLVSIPIILQYYGVEFLGIIPEGEGRPPGTFGNSVFAGAFLSLCTMVTAYYILDRLTSKRLLYVLVSMLTIQLVALMFTETRASIFAFSIFALIFGTKYLIKHHSTRNYVVATAITISVLSIFIIQGGITRFTQIPEELPSRMQYWKGAITLASLSPIYGLGPDTFRYYYLRISPASEIGIPEEPDHAHSWYFHHLAETGYVGAALATGLTTLPVLASPSLAPIFIGRSAEQVVGVGRISDILLLYVLLGIAYHESTRSFRIILRTITHTIVTNYNKLRSFSPSR